MSSDPNLLNHLPNLATTGFGAAIPFAIGCFTTNYPKHLRALHSVAFFIISYFVYILTLNCLTLFTRFNIIYSLFGLLLSIAAILIVIRCINRVSLSTLFFLQASFVILLTFSSTNYFYPKGKTILFWSSDITELSITRSDLKDDESFTKPVTLEFDKSEADSIVYIAIYCKRGKPYSRVNRETLFSWSTSDATQRIIPLAKACSD